jgi:hypothetical protein
VAVFAGIALIPAGARAAGHFKPCVSGDTAPFAHYYLGESFESLPLTGRSYDCGRPSKPPGPIARPNFADYLYGDCEPPPDGGCAPPLEVQTTPACDRWWGQYNLGFPDEPIVRPKLRKKRGVPSARLDDSAIELYTDDVTVTVYADDLARARRAVAALRRAPDSPAGADAGEPLPHPITGALRGRIGCGFSFSKLSVSTRQVHDGWRAVVKHSLRRAAYVDVELERRSHGKWVGSDQALYRASKGTTRHAVHVRRGRYRATITATDHRGRRTQVRTLRFRTGGKE